MPESLPTGGGHDTGRDYITELPDEVRGSILFRLPLKEAGRTTTLSSRWRAVFKHSPITLDDEHVARRRVGRRPREAVLQAERVSAITQILAAHKGPVWRVRLAKTRFQGDGDGQGIDAKAFATRGVEELVVHSTVHPVQFFPAPPLRSLYLINCHWSSPAAAAVFAHIKELYLRAVVMSEADVHALMEQCAALESLLLSSHLKDQKGRIICQVPVGIAKLHVRSPSLRRLTLDIGELAEVVVVDAPPNLERLLGGVQYDVDVHCKVTLVNTPKLEIVGFLTMNLTLVDYVPPFQVMISGMSLELPGPIHSVKMLGLCVNISSIFQVNQMLQTLRIFPSLETPHIKIFTQNTVVHTLYSEAEYAWFLELAGTVDCLRDSVKTIVVSDMHLLTPCCELQFAKMLLGSAKKLQLMKIFSGAGAVAAKHIRLMRRNWGLESGATSNARFVIAKKSTLSNQVIDVALDDSGLLVMPDPFYCQRMRTGPKFLVGGSCAGLKWTSCIAG